MKNAVNFVDLAASAVTCGVTGAAGFAFMLVYAVGVAPGDLVEVKIVGMLLFSLLGYAMSAGLIFALSHRFRIAPRRALMCRRRLQATLSSQGPCSGPPRAFWQGLGGRFSAQGSEQRSGSLLFGA